MRDVLYLFTAFSTLTLRVGPTAEATYNTNRSGTFSIQSENNFLSIERERERERENNSRSSSSCSSNRLEDTNIIPYSTEKSETIAMLYTHQEP